MTVRQELNTIYIRTCLVNGKVNIGQTWYSLEKRAGKNGKGYKNCPHFWNAIQLYGWNNFITDILIQVKTQEEADYWELYYQDIYDSCNKNKGYNVKEGGSYGKHSEESKKKMSKSRVGKMPPMTGKRHSEETKQKMSDDRKGDLHPLFGKHHTEDTKQKISKARTANPSNNKGQKRTPEQKQKMSDAHKGKKQSEETKKKISASKRGKKKSEETKKKMSLAQIGNKKMLGKKHSPETRKKMSESAQKRKQNI